MMALECGDGQAEEIAELFSDISNNIKIVKDYSGIERIVLIRKQ